MEWDLLEKTTFRIDDVHLSGADLGEVATAAGRALGLAPHELMVVDVREGFIEFDVLVHTVQAEAIGGKEEALLTALRDVAHVTVGDTACVHSQGVLGFIGMPPEEAQDAIEKSSAMMRGLERQIERRAVVFSSGAEVMAGEIEDTNAPYLLKALEGIGYEARFGGIMEDNRDSAVAHLTAAVNSGYGLIITTGGVGAEDKDYNVEAALHLDPVAHTPYILKFKVDGHRHHKNGVRIAVGRVGTTRIVCLPGPHEETKLGCACILSAIRKGQDDETLANAIAEVLRDRWRKMMQARSAWPHAHHDR